MSKIMTSLAIITVPEGKKISYTFSEVDAFGNIIKSNIRESFLAVGDSTLSDMIDKFEKKVIADKNVK